MALRETIITWITRRAANRFEHATQDPVRVQRDKLLDLMSKNQDTEYGRRHGFSSIKAIEDYQKQVPVVTYEDIKEDMKRVAEGARNVFTNEDPVMFAQTSGTTGDPKYIPVTPTCQGREHSDVMRTWLYNAQQSHRIFSGKIVSMVSPAFEGHAPSGIPIGSTSGHMYKNNPGLVKRGYSTPYRAFEIEDYHAKYYTIMRIALDDDVRFLATANPSSILKLCEKADENKEQMIRDVHDGTLSEDLNIQPDIRRDLVSRMRRNPKRAKFLERAARSGILKPGDYWPDLALIGCWKGGTVGHYLEKFGRWFTTREGRRIPTRDWGFLASEVRGSVPLEDEGCAGVLTIASNFFEFVEVDDLMAKQDNPEAWDFLTVGDIEDGKEYYIFVTTTAGLYRYDMNDIVKVNGFYNKTPQIEFVRKGRGMTNITGEKLSVNQIIAAFQKASADTGIIPDHFKAEADVDNSRYVFRLEPTKPVDTDKARRFLTSLDSSLKDINIEYKAKRESTRLGNPILHIMREGWYERDRKKLVESGRRAFQAKTELLSAKKLMTQEMRPEIEKVVELEG